MFRITIQNSDILLDFMKVKRERNVLKIIQWLSLATVLVKQEVCLVSGEVSSC